MLLIQKPAQITVWLSLVIKAANTGKTNMPELGNSFKCWLFGPIFKCLVEYEVFLKAQPSFTILSWEL